MFILFLLFRKHKRLLKILTLLSLLLFLSTVVFMVYIFKNIGIQIVSMEDLVNAVGMQLIAVNNTQFDVYLEDVKLVLNMFEFSDVEMNKKPYERQKIEGKTTLNLLLEFPILKRYDVKDVNGSIVIVASKWHIKVPFKHHINIP